MKIKRLISFLLTLVLLGSPVPALAADAGSRQDPLLSRSYVDSWSSAVLSHAEATARSTAQAALDKALQTHDNALHSAAARSRICTIYAGSTVALKTGDCFTVLSGDAGVTISAGALVDATVGAEAVSRWQNPEEGLLKPSKYIDLMIRAGTITELDLYMLRCACVQLQTWKREGRGTLWLSCNFTRQSIADEKILARVREIVEQYDFTRDRLAVELTEDSYAHDRETALRTIEGLHAMGLRIVLDDIGAGYSSLSDLSTYPIDGVKIDRSIVIESALPRAHALLEGMIRLSHDMGIRVLCEGVEDKATCDAVLAAGCDFIQGFYFSRVLPGREAESFLRSLAARDREEG